MSTPKYGILKKAILEEDELGEIVVFYPPPLLEVSVKRLFFQADGSTTSELVYVHRVENLRIEGIVELVNRAIENNQRKD